MVTVTVREGLANLAGARWELLALDRLPRRLLPRLVRLGRRVGILGIGLGMRLGLRIGLGRTCRTCLTSFTPLHLPIYLPYISPISPPYLPDISAAARACRSSSIALCAAAAASCASRSVLSLYDSPWCRGNGAGSGLYPGLPG